MGEGKRNRGFLVMVALLAAVMSPAGAGREKTTIEDRLPKDGRNLVATIGGRRVLVDTALGSITPLELPTRNDRAATAGASGGASADGSEPEESGASDEQVRGWDPRLAGMRRSPFYPTVNGETGPGAITTILGGMCDGLAGTRVPVVPGTLKADAAGRLFWSDTGWNGHVASLPKIRTLGRDGIVRTLGTIGGPIEGRFDRDNLTNSLARITPDGEGGVYYTYLAWFTGIATRGWPFTWSFDDLPEATVIGRLHADGSHEFVSGVRVNGGNGLLSPWAYRRGDGGAYQNAGWVFINALVADSDGNLYVADGEPPETGAISSAAYGPDPEATSTEPNPMYVGPHGENDDGVVRFLNRSSRAVTFYAGTSQEITVPAGRVQTIAGSLDADSRQRPTIGHPVSVGSADFRFVAGIDLDRQGNLMMLEVGEGLVRILGINTGPTKVSMLGVSVAPGTVAVLGGGQAGYGGDGGIARAARFEVRDASSWFYGDLATTSDGGVLIADTVNHRIRSVDSSGRVATIAGSGGAGFNGDGRTAPGTALHFPMGVDVLPSGDPVFADWANARVRTVHGGTVRTLAGNGSATTCAEGGRVSRPRPGTPAPYGPARNAAFAAGTSIGRPHDVAADSRGNIYVADPVMGVVWRIDPSGVTRPAIGVPARCTVSAPHDRYASPCVRSGVVTTGPRSAVRLLAPAFLLVDRYDNLYVADGPRVLYVNFGARELTAHGVSVLPDQIAMVLDRSDTRRGGLLGGMALDEAGNLYVANITGNQVVTVNWCGVVSVLAGTGAPSLADSSNGDGGPALAAALSPRGIAFDRDRKLLLIADLELSLSFTGRVRAVNLGATPANVWGRRLQPGSITTYLGRAQNRPGSSRGDGGHALDATMVMPYGVSVHPGGRVFVSDAFANVVRVVERDGTVGTLAGMTPPMDLASDGSWQFMIVGGECGDGGPAGEACLQRPVSTQLAPGGDLLVADYESGRVRRITDALHAPVRKPVPAFAGSAWRFTPRLRLQDGQGLDAIDPSLAFDADGNLLILATLRTPSDAVGCGLWRYTPAGASGGRDAARFLGVADGAVSQPIPNGVGVAGFVNVDLIGKGACSVTTVSNGGGLDAVLGEGRIAYASGTRAFTPIGGGDGDAGASVVRNVVTGSSTDGTQFASSFFGVAARALIVKNPFLASAGDASYMSFDYTQRFAGAGPVPVDGLGFARSVDGTTYVHLSDFAQLTHPLTLRPLLYELFHSEPVAFGDDDIAIPYHVEVCVAPVERCAQEPDWDSNGYVAVSRDGGATWKTSKPVFSYPCFRMGAPGWLPDAWCEGYHGLPQLAADSSGTLYMTWDDSRHVYLSSSRDGEHWSSPSRVDRGLSAAAYPTLVAGDDGRVGVAFYGTTSPTRDASSPWAEWWVYLASTQNGAAPRPAFSQSVVSATPVHHAELCQEGVACWWTASSHIAGTPVGSYFRAGLDPQDGRVIIAYTEDAGLDSEATTPGVVVTRQCDGPALLANRPASRPCASVPQSPPRALPDVTDLPDQVGGGVPPAAQAPNLSPCSAVPPPAQPRAPEPPPPAPAPEPVPEPPVVTVNEPPAPPVRPPAAQAPIPPGTGVQSSFSESQAAQGQIGAAIERQEQARTALARAADAVREQEELAMIRTRRGAPVGPWHTAAALLAASAMFGIATRTRTRLAPAHARRRRADTAFERSFRRWEE